MIDNIMLESIVNSALADVGKSKTNVGGSDSFENFSIGGCSGVFEMGSDGKGKILSINDAFREFIEKNGHDAAEFTTDIFSIIEPKFREDLRRAICNSAELGEEQHVMVRSIPLKIQSQSPWVHLRLKAITISGHNMFFASTENRKLFEGSLSRIAEYSTLLLEAIDALDIGIIIFDQFTEGLLYANSGLKRLLFLDEEKAIHSLDDVPIEGFRQLLTQTSFEESVSSKEVVLAGGVRKILKVWVGQYSGDHDATIAVLKTEKLCSSANLKNSSVKIINSAAVGDNTFELSMGQIGAVIINLNATTGKITATDGYERFAFSEVDSMILPEIYLDALVHSVHPDDVVEFRGALADLKKCPTTVSLRFRAELKTGEYEWVTQYSTSFFDDKGKISRVVSTIINVDTDEKKNRRYKERAEMDTLTCVFNRSTSESRMLDVIKSNDLNTCYFVLLDIDDFKDVNDMYGHPAGDEVLKNLGSLLRRYTRSTDVVGRIGGDEFTILYCNMPSKDIVLRKMEELREEFRWLRMKYDTKNLGSVSFGVVGPASSFNGFQELYEAADNAMYTNKREKKDSN